MTNVPDFQLRGTSEVSSLPEPPRSRRWAAWVLGLLLVAVVGVAVYYATIWRARPMAEQATASYFEGFGRASAAKRRKSMVWPP